MVMHEGVAGCENDVPFVVEVDVRRSYRATVRSVDAASAALPSGINARSSIGLSAAV